MNKLIQKILLIGLLLWCASCEERTSLEATAENQADIVMSVQTVGEQIAASKAVREQKKKTLEIFKNEPAYKTADGKRTLEASVDELANAASIAAANSDPARPKIVRAFAAPVELDGVAYLGTRWGGDSPDTFYRIFPVDGKSSYRLTFVPVGTVPAHYSLVIWDTFMGEDTKQGTTGETKLLDTVIDSLLDQEIVAEADGSFTIMIDSAPTSGRQNHLQSTDEAKMVLIREYMNDWVAQRPFKISIERIAGEDMPAPSFDSLTETAADMLAGVTKVLQWWLKNTQGFASETPNTLNTPFLRGGGWGFSSGGQFKLRGDDALIVTVDPLGADFLNAMIWNPWAVTPEPIHRNISMNNTQAEANSDGSYTFVFSSKDPGIRNWIDTQGLENGFFFFRWALLPESFASTDGAIRSVEFTTHQSLANLLPKEATRYTEEMRKQQLKERAASFYNRFGME